MMNSHMPVHPKQRSATIASVIASRPRSSRPAQAPLTSARQPSKTSGTVNYLEPSPDGTAPHVYLVEPPQGVPKISFVRSETTVDVHNLREFQDRFTLKERGIELRKLEIPEDIDWENKEEVSQRYYPLVEKLLLEATGASRVHIFDHTLRKGHIEAPGKDLVRTVEGRQQPVGMVHVDYTAESGIDRLDALLPEEADKLRQTPFAVIQVWRPLKGPVKSSPLGVIDVSTLGKNDLISYSIHFEDRVGYNYGVKYNPNHRWYYAKDMGVDEAYVFTCYDSRKDRARFTPHTGFRDNEIGPEAPPRESVELRSYCFWEHEPNQKVDRNL